MIALPVTLVAYAGWRRSRYFGNAVPLSIAGLFAFFGVGAVDFPGQGFHLIAIVFLFVFAAGVCADLLETRYGPVVMAGLWGLMTVSAVDNIWRLVRFAQ